jgi:hypothetical protein
MAHSRIMNGCKIWRKVWMKSKISAWFKIVFSDYLLFAMGKTKSVQWRNRSKTLVIKISITSTEQMHTVHLWMCYYEQNRSYL